MTVRISRALLDQVITEADRSPDREVCGLLFGGGAAGRIMSAQPTSNVADDPRDSFEIDPAMLFAAIRAERAGAPPIIGHYHSHPNGLARPSARDAAAVSRPGWIWLIVAGGRAAAWREVPGGPVHGAFAGVELVVDGGEAGCAY
jgi:desampylase